MPICGSGFGSGAGVGGDHAASGSAARTSSGRLTSWNKKVKLSQGCCALDQRRLDQTEVMAQQQRLLALIAGTAELETFLAQLNDLADKHQVVVISTEPGSVERAPVAVASSDEPAAEDGVGDPLLMQGLEKRSAQIEVEGSFVEVLAFLQSLENLQVFVITQDLSVVAARAADDDAMKVRLGLTLLAYGAVNSLD